MSVLRKCQCTVFATLNCKLTDNMSSTLSLTWTGTALLESWWRFLFQQSRRNWSCDPRNFTKK